MSRRGASGLSGIFAIDKPAGMTSHDVVNRVRRIIGEKRVGHAGTLDPDATGVLIVCVGPATRLVDLLHAEAKGYEARIVFGAETDTCDAAGEITLISAIPDEIAEPAFATGFVASLVGEHEQMPPAYSAIKVDGVPAHRLARKGEDVALTPRSITIEAAHLTGIDVSDAGIWWDAEFDVSKGTYIRSLARDIGRALDSAAHLGVLRRVRSGNVTVADCVSLAELESAPNPTAHFIDPVVALGLPVVHVEDASVPSIALGNGLPNRDGIPEGRDVAIVSGPELLAIHTSKGAQLVPRMVFPVPVSIPASTPVARVVRFNPSNGSLGPAVVAIGAFDGVHLGHRTLIEAAIDDAARRGVSSVALTFEPDPDEVVSATPAPRLMSHEQRIETLAATGVDVVLVVGFTPEMASLAGYEFLDSVVAVALDPVAIHVGEDFRFGARADADVTDLRAWADARGGEVRAHELVDLDYAPITATRIRAAIDAGDLASAERMLGHPYTLRGLVRRGRGEGASLVGFPTANVELAEAIELPPDGGYAAIARVDGVAHRAAVSLGIPPTFPSSTDTVEVHIIGFSGDLYGHIIEVDLVERIRGMERFDTIDELRARIAEDIERAKDIVAGRL